MTNENRVAAHNVKQRSTRDIRSTFFQLVRELVQGNLSRFSAGINLGHEKRFNVNF